MENISINSYMKDLDENYQYIREKIALAAVKSGRSPEAITFLAASKTVEPERINHAIALGLDAVGENRAQELLAKYALLQTKSVNKECAVHFIGHLQSNKVRQIIDKVSMIHSVDSIHLAEEIQRQAQLHNRTMDILLEVNIGREENKSGVLPEAAMECAMQLAQFPNLRLRGLMTVPPVCDKTEVRRYFSQIHDLFIDIRDKNIDNIYMDTLSMGMSSDYEEAILEGATTVRIGSALFGARYYPNK